MNTKLNWTIGIVLAVIVALCAAYLFRNELISAWCSLYYAIKHADANFRLGNWGFQCVVGRSW